jgi:hypothetical protein
MLTMIKIYTYTNNDRMNEQNKSTTLLLTQKNWLAFSIARNIVRRTLSANAGLRLASVIPSPDPTHVGAASIGSILFFSPLQETDQ